MSIDILLSIFGRVKSSYLRSFANNSDSKVIGLQNKQQQNNTTAINVFQEKGFKKSGRHSWESTCAFRVRVLMRWLPVKVLAIWRRFPFIFFCILYVECHSIQRLRFLYKVRNFGEFGDVIQWFLHFSSPFRFILPTAPSFKLIWPSTAKLLRSCC